MLRLMEPSKYIAYVFLAITCLSAVSRAGNIDYEEAVRVECGHTRYPTLCVQTLTPLGSRVPRVDFLSALVNNTISQTKMPDSFFGSLTASTSISPNSLHVKTATGKFIFFISPILFILFLIVLHLFNTSSSVQFIMTHFY